LLVATYQITFTSDDEAEFTTSPGPLLDDPLAIVVLMEAGVELTG